MLDVHPPHHPTHTWKDFFIHIATITVGLLIAIGLEQTVEAIHHRHQREQLTEQMRTEAEKNLELIRSTEKGEAQQIAYLTAIRDAILHGRVSGSVVVVAPLVHPPQGGGLIISPSRGTWAAAQTSGIAALLPAEQAKIYARLDFSTSEEARVRDDMLTAFSLLRSEYFRVHYNTNATTDQTLSVAGANDLLFRIDQAIDGVIDVVVRLAILEGADQALIDGVLTLDETYAYQRRAVQRVKATYGIDRDLNGVRTPTAPL